MKNRLKKSIAFITGIVSAFSLLPNDFKAMNNNAVAEGSFIAAFPGAVGVGKYATGGRGGDVVHVTNLNDSGDGSFRDAVSKPNRIVVFDVSGTIELEGNVTVADNITIAGQTAPGGSGITLKNYKIGLAGDNIICRYLSSRPGPYKSTSSGNDAWGGAKGSNSIIDHCSMSYATDEQWGLYSANKYTTVQYSVIGPSDSWGGHKKGIHGFGVMMPGTSTFDHNLILHNVSRNFRGKIGGTETCDFTNNVIYNWGYQTAYGTIGHLNYVNNTLKIGPNTTNGYNYMNIDSSTNPQNFKVFIFGNRFLNRDNTPYSNLSADNWSGVKVSSSIGISLNDVKTYYPFATYGTSDNRSTVADAESAEASYEHVISLAGNGISSDTRTDIDRQCAYETMTGTGVISGTASYDDADSTDRANLDKYGIKCGVQYVYPSAVTKKTITDSDNDGMADEWEKARGLNPDDPTDTNGDYCGLGYTNIEYYINDLTVNSFPEGVVTLSPETAEVKLVFAFENIEAESFDEQYGVSAEECSDGGENIGYIENGDYLRYNSVNFEEGAKSFTVNAACDNSECVIQLYLDSTEGSPVAECSVTSTGGWQKWSDISFNIPTIKGKHDLYLKFVGGDGFLVNINRFVFGRQSIAESGKLIGSLNIMDSERSDYWHIADKCDDGITVYGDRDFTFVSVPDNLKKAEYIRTACDSKFYSESLAEFTAKEDINVYIGMDSRVAPLPSWLEEWDNTDIQLKASNEVTFELYQKKFSRGETVKLGANGQSSYCVNYIVFAVESEENGIKGDANCDGEVNMSDAVLIMQSIANPDKYGLNGTDETHITSQGKKNADVTGNQDGMTNADALSVQMFMLKLISEFE